MGIFDFMKGAGEKIFQPGEAKREAAIKRHLGSYGSDYAGVDVDVDGDKAILTGRVPNVAARERAVLIAGNVDGIDKVDDRLVADAAPSFAGVTGGSASTEAPAPAGASSTMAHGSPGGEGWQSRTYTVKPGDTLSKIAREMYGDANQYPRIFEANQPMLKDPDKIYPGQVLRIP